ncbi:hypothetical protein R80B4_01813 [Fibrobacteres bacterium R8-0-B4]
MGIDITKKPLPVGESFFDRVIEDGSYYVDKTLLVKDILDRNARVTLCTRPRRFGKTLNQTMLKCFFEDTARVGGKDTRALFRGLLIEAAGERYMEHQGKYPVIFLTFKEAKRNTFDDSYTQLKSFIAKEFDRHRYVCEKIASVKRRELFEKMADGDASLSEYSASLLFLCECLENYYGKKTVILIDEYDVPLENSWSRPNRFYDEMINFIRPLLSSAFKDNPHLQTGVITGCLRVSKESIFTGLNNLEVVSILNKSYSEYFGFTQAEMDDILNYYGLSDKRQIVRDWYNGYLFGNTEVYNPWSSVFVVNSWRTDVTDYPQPYWVNTSGNAVIHDMIDNMNAEAKDGLETLMAGGTVSAAVHEDVTYGEIYKETDNLWNFLLFTGYLKKAGDGRMAGVQMILDLSIPNFELLYIYKTKIKEWFRDKIASKNLDALHNAVLSGDVETFQNELSAVLSESISYMDSAESFYHGVMVGALARINGYRIKSNRESGDGRYDLALYSANHKNGTAVIFEFKAAKEFKQMSILCEDALKQIEDKNYAADWIDNGYKNIIKYGIGFFGKSCEIQKGG